MFLLLMAVLALVVLHVSRPRKHLLILAPLSLLFVDSALCFAFWRTWGLSQELATISLYAYILLSFVGMLADRWMRKPAQGSSSRSV
jgi:hypothetical protein